MPPFPQPHPATKKPILNPQQVQKLSFFASGRTNSGLSHSQAPFNPPSPQHHLGASHFYLNSWRFGRTWLRTDGKPWGPEKQGELAGSGRLLVPASHPSWGLGSSSLWVLWPTPELPIWVKFELTKFPLLVTLQPFTRSLSIPSGNDHIWPSHSFPNSQTFTATFNGWACRTTKSSLEFIRFSVLLERSFQQNFLDS
jgi:hypothetical protein